MSGQPQLFGRDDLVDQVVREAHKGRHILLKGPVGVGKSAVLNAARLRFKGIVVHLVDHQAKGQFVEIARQLFETGILPAHRLDLPEQYCSMAPADVDWKKIRRIVNRANIRDLTGAIIPSIAEAKEAGTKVIIAVDDISFVTPTQIAFWLAIADHAQLVFCASRQNRGTSKLWWRTRKIEVSPLCDDDMTTLVRHHIVAHGMLIESPELYVTHAVKQAQGMPQAAVDMLTDTSKERRVTKRQVREMAHDAGVRYLDFTPAVLLLGASIVAMRFVGIGTGDTVLYVAAGIGAALFLTVRMFLFTGMSR